MTERHDSTSRAERADTASARRSVEVLYVDGDAATRERIRRTLTERAADATVSGVGSVDAAVDLATATPPSCLVIDPCGLDDVDRLLTAVDCPLVLYTDRDPSALDESLLDAAATVVEKGEDGCGALLTEKVIGVTAETTERTEYALNRALDDIESWATDSETTALVAEDGAVVWASDPVDAVLGEADATSIYDRLAARCVEAVDRSRVARLREDPTETATLRLDGDDGERYVLCRGHRLPEDAGSLRLLRLADVTERARRGARQSLLELLTDHAQDGLYTLDERGVVDFCNESFAEMLGYEPGELCGEHASLTLAPGELETGQQTIEQLLASDGEDATVELTLRRKDGTELQASIHYTLLRDDGGAYRGLMGVVRDVTERREHERELRRRRELFDSLVSHFPNGGVFLFDEDFEYQMAGGTELDRLGLEPEDFIGNTPRDIFPPDNAALLEDAYAAALDGETAGFEDEFKGTHYHVQAMPIRDEDGAVTTGLAVAQNVTARVERKRELEQSHTLLSTLFDALPVGVLLDGRNREVLRANEHFVELFELSNTPEELVGTDCATVAERVHEQYADPEAATDDSESLVSARETRLREEVELADGRTFQRSYLPIELPDGPANLWLYRDVTERTNRERELRETSERLELAIEGAELGVWDWNAKTGDLTFDERWAGMLGYSRDELDPHVDAWEELVHPDDLDRAWNAIRTHIDGETDIYQCDHRLRTKSGDYRWIRDIGRVFERDDDGEAVRFVGIHQDITERKERQQELEAQRDELATLTQVHILIQDVLRTLGSAATRAEIERTVCERLVESDLFELAWIGDREGRSTHLSQSTTAGDDEGYLDRIREMARTVDRENDPGTVAIRTGEPQIIHDVATDERMETWRDEALDRDFRSAAVIPLRHDEVVHAALVVYANRAEAFSSLAVDALTVLGEMIGFALTAVQNRQLLAHDRVVELEFQAEGTGSPFVDVAREHDCRFESAGCVDIGDAVLQYLTVEGASPTAVLDSLLNSPAIDDGRVVRGEDDGGVVELRMSETYQSLLLDVGARLVGFAADSERLSLTVEAPTDAEPRTIRETLADRLPGIELLAKRERERRPTTERSGAALRERVTDRQLEVLRAAYLAGYYEWPRDTTAEQLAETLNIASPTLHQHLRRAERNLFEGFLDV
ncbi:PAS domain S-box protein [Haloarcula nitratireducens]|uniref:histidine kinase n=1 Tax=Haloarcula nitratireducens TaxID=2487749 RepID=A0AAW4P6Z9_9EURY|nr:PAS domain S-box protein [Halomicroarcula nitratireducens]MBX0293375.1 PAS domain S-box protein [Halomicroarcula nitratireducens]